MGENVIVLRSDGLENPHATPAEEGDVEFESALDPAYEPKPSSNSS